MTRELLLSLRLALMLMFLVALPIRADVVKPALIEIQVDVSGQVTIEIRTSVEALLTGINGQFKYTQDAPQAQQYDELRVLAAPELHHAFDSFSEEFLNSVILEADGKPLSLTIRKLQIPEPGYTKVPRNSVIELETALPHLPAQLRWYYPSQFGDQAVRLKQINRDKNEWHWSDYQWIREDRFSQPFTLQAMQSNQSVLSVVKIYIEAGFRHILPLGLDHILFVLGLMLLLQGAGLLFWQVTMFTFAHSLTLAVASYEVISLPANWVEPLIALSIVYIGIENLTIRASQARRLIVVFAFGLLHGFGFASMLAQFGLPDNHFLLALIAFNLGVEIGQLVILLIVWIAIFSWLKDKKLQRNLIVIPGSLIISGIGALWFFERLNLLS